MKHRNLISGVHEKTQSCQWRPPGWYWADGAVRRIQGRTFWQTDKEKLSTRTSSWLCSDTPPIVALTLPSSSLIGRTEAFSPLFVYSRLSAVALLQLSGPPAFWRDLQWQKSRFLRAAGGSYRRLRYNCTTLTQRSRLNGSICRAERKQLPVAAGFKSF